MSAPARTNKTQINRMFLASFTSCVHREGLSQLSMSSSSTAAQQRGHAFWGWNCLPRPSLCRPQLGRELEFAKLCRACIGQVPASMVNVPHPSRRQRHEPPAPASTCLKEDEPGGHPHARSPPCHLHSPHVLSSAGLIYLQHGLTASVPQGIGTCLLSLRMHSVTTGLLAKSCCSSDQCPLWTGKWGICKGPLYPCAYHIVLHNRL